MAKPDFLYHGGKQLVKELVPHQATGVGNEKDQLLAVYATSNREFAILYTLPILPDETGSISWRTIAIANGIQKMKLTAGRIDYSRRGYLYKVSAEPFEQIDEIQWVSFRPVAPYEYEEIDPNDYRHLVV